MAVRKVADASSIQRTHCSHGHSLSGDNLHFYKGNWLCRACRRATMARYMAKRGAPKPMDEPTAMRAMAALQDGQTLTTICGGRIGGKHVAGLWITTREKFWQYCAEHQDYAAQAKTLLAKNAERAYWGRGSVKRAQTHCKRGHPLTADNVYILRRNGTTSRSCKTCVTYNSTHQPMPTQEQINSVTAALNAGETIGEICWGIVDGKRRTKPHILGFQKLKQYREQNPDFDRFVLSSIGGNISKGHQRRKLTQLSRMDVARSEQNDYYAIRELLPKAMLRDDQDEIVSSVILALCDGSLRRDQIRERIREFVQAHYREERNGVGKYGLVSLDAPICGDSSVSRIEMITHGMWD